MICEQYGEEVDLTKIPIPFSSLSYDCQLAMEIFNILPDRIEGMNGTWLGKDFAPLECFMNIYEIEDRRKILNLIIIIQQIYEKHYREQKTRSSKKR